MKRLLNLFFFHLYHSLAWGYDIVAWTVSLGRWNRWGNTVLDLLPPGRILELGFGPGHLQHTFSRRGIFAFGLDESGQMAHQAIRRSPGARLVRARAEAAPFLPGSFQGVVAVFPAPYIFKPQAAQQIAHLLASGGVMVILMAARPTGPRLADRFIRALFFITGETPGSKVDFSPVLITYRQAGIQARIEWITKEQGDLLYLTGVKM